MPGTKADGLTDDTGDIQAAINSAPAGRILDGWGGVYGVSSLRLHNLPLSILVVPRNLQNLLIKHIFLKNLLLVFNFDLKFLKF